MTTQATASPHFDSGALPGLPLQVRARTLLIMMLTVPFGILCALADTYLFNDFLRIYARDNPAVVIWWVAILSTPHIISSLVTFADREYLGHYAPYLIRGVAIAVSLGVLLPFLVGLALKPDEVGDIGFEGISSYGADMSLVVAAAYTTYHNLQQQYGISLMLMQERPALRHHLWKWITIVPASLVFIGLNFYHTGEEWEVWNNVLAVAGVNGVLALLIAGYIVWKYLQKPAYSKIGLAYFCANAAMVFVCFGLSLKGYALIAILLPRIVHDLTAYWIYMVHDENRNAGRMRNPFYVLPKKIGISPAVFCVPLSFIVGYALLELGDTAYVIGFFVIALNYIHYYLEGIIWKRGTPHRQHVPFT